MRGSGRAGCAALTLALAYIPRAQLGRGWEGTDCKQKVGKGRTFAINSRHCEERSDEAIHLLSRSMPDMDCRVGLRPPRNDERGLGASLLSMHQNKSRHCEEQRDEAIHLSVCSTPAMDCRVGLRPPRNDEVYSVKSQFVIARCETTKQSMVRTVSFS